MKFKIFFFSVLVMLLNSGFVVSQSIKGLMVPTVHLYKTVLPQSKAAMNTQNTARDSVRVSNSAILPKGSFLPKPGQNNTLLPTSYREKLNNTAKTVGAPSTQSAPSNPLVSFNTMNAESFESVDTSGFSKIPTLESIAIQNPVSGFETVDTERLKNIKTAPIKGIETTKKSIETVDTAWLLKSKNNNNSIITSHTSPYAETVDTATLIARTKPKYVVDAATYKPKYIYKSQTITGTILPKGGSNNLFMPIQIDTGTYLAPLPDVKSSFDFPGSDKFPAASPKGIGQLDELLPLDTVKLIESNSPLGELADLDMGNGNTRIDGGNKYSGNTYFYDTAKVKTDKRGKTFSGTLLSKAGKSTLLQPEVFKVDSSAIMKGALVDGASAYPYNYPDSSDVLRVNFYVNNAGKYYVCFSNNNYYINLSQFGYINEYIFKSGNQKDVGNNFIHKNVLGMVDNIGGSPVEYSETHLITRIGTWAIKYTFDDMIESIGAYKLYYNSNATIKKIDQYRINYDAGKVVMNIEDSRGLIIFKPVEKKK